MASVAEQIDNVITDAVSRLKAIGEQMKSESITPVQKVARTRIVKTESSGDPHRIKVLPKEGRKYVTICDLQEEIDIRQGRKVAP